MELSKLPTNSAPQASKPNDNQPTQQLNQPAATTDNQPQINTRPKKKPNLTGITVPITYLKMSKPTGAFDMNRRADYDESLKLQKPESEKTPSEVNPKPVEDQTADQPLASNEPIGSQAM